jgi:NhaP-type Na+/H+ or K+/H+ antiporter
VSGFDLAVVAVVLGGYALVSGRLSSGPLSGPILFTAAGVVVGSSGLDLLGVGEDVESIQLLAEVTLALVLFGDASRLDLRRLRRELAFPARLLLIGLPLSILIGAAIGAVVFPGLLLAEALVLAVLLAPTDAALGEAVVSDRRLPSRLRQALNVESGLNDGICVPLLFAAIALAEIEARPSLRGQVLVDLAEEVAIAVGVGVGVAAVAALAFQRASGRGWVEARWSRSVPLVVVALAYVFTAELGGSGFIACFVAGLVVGGLLGDATEDAIELVEESGVLLSGATFFLAGAVFVGPLLGRLTVPVLVYAVLSLTLVRMVPVAVALVRSGADLPTMAFAGWFGPRGLATIVFALTVVQEADLAGGSTVLDVAGVTVVLSIVAHGVTAPGLTERFVRRYPTGDPAAV